ncbi:MAG TPA: type III pantothenate kinase [Blastocatellia bacterium]|jgi:type III pantothenate kinase|nr:type III pantothenate kinase [Blastocatellia bacterium]
MLLVLDVGNTNTTLGLFDGAELKHSWRLTSERQRTVDEYGIMCLTLLQLAGLRPGLITEIVISSVVPPLDFTLNKMAEVYFEIKPLFIDAANSGMPVLYDDPQEVGPDRIVNAVAAFARYGGPCVIVDFGTATTFDVISGAGEYLGGIICPGIQISADALFQRAARLRRIEIRQPSRVIGTNTTASVQSGLYYGNVGQVDGVIEQIIGELGERPRVIATGGLAPLISKGSRHIEAVENDLTLEGMRLIYERQAGGQSKG